MFVTCSVVSGRDPDAIVQFVNSLNASVAVARSHIPDLRFETTAILNAAAEDPVTAARLEGRCMVVRNDQPRGFAANHNAAMLDVGSDFHIVANDDVEVPSDAIASILEILRRPESARIGAFSPKLLELDGSLQPSTYSFPTFAATTLQWSGLRRRLPGGLMRILAAASGRGDGQSRHWAHDRALTVDTFRGAFAVMRMEAVRDVGPMTEVALVGGEEVEWHARLAANGWSCFFTPEVEVTHEGGKTVSARPELQLEYVKGTVNFFAQHRSRLAFALVKVLGLFREFVITRQYRREVGTDIPRFGERLRDIRFRESFQEDDPRPQDEASVPREGKRAAPTRTEP